MYDVKNYSVVGEIGLKLDHKVGKWLGSTLIFFVDASFGASLHG